MIKTVLVSVYAIILSLAANVFAASGQAGTPDPAGGATNVPLGKVLTWIAGSDAVSHDVYFGTNAAAVANAHRLAGDLNGNGRVDYNDLSILTNYWLHNPAGSVPYAGVNDNNIVDFNDFALLANNWKNQASSCFKGNTTSCSYDPNLATNTTYYWRVDEVGGSGTVQGNVWSFTTAAPGPEFTFVQATDPQMGWGQCGNMDYLWGTTISKINNINPAFVIVTGDLINTATSSTQTATYKSYAVGINPLIPIYTLPGNHDISEPSNSTKYAWWLSNLAYPTAGLTNPWYSFTYNDSIFICLDSGVFRSDWGSKQAAEIAWLTQTLADANSTGYTHKFVFMHISLCLSSVNEAYQGSSGFNLPVAIRGQLLSLFHQYKVTAVFQGHYHLNAYVNDNGLEIITTSSCTCGLGTPPTTPGIQIIKVYSDHIEHEYRTLDSLP